MISNCLAGYVFFFPIIDSRHFYFNVVNDYVGFGLMDASKMIALASNWETVPNVTTCTIPRLGVNK